MTFFEQCTHEAYSATSQFWISILGKAEEYQATLAQTSPPDYTALTIIEKHLAQHDFF